MSQTDPRPTKSPQVTLESKSQPSLPQRQMDGEQGGPKGPEPTRYGDWEQKGRCTDF